jgi:hypothetical protein
MIVNFIFCHDVRLNYLSIVQRLRASEHISDYKPMTSLDPRSYDRKQASEPQGSLESLPDYTYLPLKPGEDTRTVTLLPSADVNDDIVCDIQNVSTNGIASVPTVSYEALSYVCGPDDPSRLIRCPNGTKLSIRPNLYDALKGLRLSNERRIIWIDQISINQRDLPERENQVRNFGVIFSRAWQVIIWIRDEYWSGIQTVFSLLDSVCTRAMEKQVNSTDPLYSGRYLDSIFDIPPANAPECVALRKFLKNIWFFRTWTFQEVALAKTGFLICGPHLLQLNRLVTLGGLLGSFKETQNAEESRFKEGADILKRIASTRMLIHPPPPPTYQGPETKIFRSLFHMLASLRDTRCFDPRDKIWAIISTADDLDEQPLQVDYRRPWQSIYTMISNWLHRRHQNLAFLQLVEIKNRMMKDGVDNNRDPNLPSWVPDFRSEPQALNVIYQPQVKLRTNRIYYASGGSRSTCEGHDMYSPHLVLNGIKLGTIIKLSEPPGNLSNGVGIGAKVLLGGEWSQLATSCSDKDGQYPPTAEPIDRAFERLRIGDQLPNEGTHRRSRLALPDELPQPRTYQYMEIAPRSNDFLVHGDTADIGICILRATTRRRMFITDTGYMGLTHRSNLVGDEIWVLMGADMPATLHPISSSRLIDGQASEPNRFEFRGESYVHGVMDGEALIEAYQRKGHNRASGAADKKWLDDLGFGPYPIDTEEIVLV